MKYVVRYNLTDQSRIDRCKTTGHNSNVEDIEVVHGNTEFSRCVDLFGVISSGTPSNDLTPTLDYPASLPAVLDAIEALIAEQKETRRRNSLAILQSRKTTECRGYAGNVRYTFRDADWPYDSDRDVTGSAEAVAWMDELAAEREAAKQAATIEDERRKRDADMERQAAEDSKRAWIASHGSERLRRCKQEGIECDSLYLEERIALDRPGWVYASDVEGDTYEPRNAKELAFEILDAARKTAPDAKLKWYKEESTYDTTGRKCYVAQAEFLDGYEILFFGNAE